MSVLSVRQPLRLASRFACSDSPGQRRPWVCQTCRAHSVAWPPMRPTTPNQRDRRRKKMAANPPRNSTSTAPHAQDTQGAAEPGFDDGSPSGLDVEAVRSMFRVGFPNTNQSELQRRHDTYGLIQALRDSNAELLRTALTRASEDASYITSIPKSTWTEIIRKLAPEYHLLPFHRIHRSLNTRQLRHAGFDLIEKRRAYMDTIVGVIKIRRQHGVHLGIVDYRMLLRYAAKTGNERAAMVLWADMKRDHIQPDVLCYNAYMEAIVWDEASRLKQRRAARQPWNWSSPKPTDIVLFKPGSSGIVTRIFKEMVNRGVSANTATYCVLMTALARDGELQAAEAIIQKSWGADTQELAQTSNLPVAQKKLSPDSPIFPDQRLLVTIAEIFGSAHQIPLAMKLIDHLSRSYGIRISAQVWYQLTRWTWLQSRLSETDRVQPSETKMQLTVVQQLTNMMMTGAYQMDPSMDQLDILFRSAGVNAGRGDERARITRLLRVFDLGRAKYVRLLIAHRDARHEAQAQQRVWVAPRTSLDRRRHAAQSALVKKRFAQQLLQRWCRQLITLKGLDFPGGHRNAEVSEWRLRGMSRFLVHYGNFAPSLVSYGLETGRVELVFRTPEEVLTHKRRKAVTDRKRHFGWYDISSVSKPWTEDWTGRRKTSDPASDLLSVSSKSRREALLQAPSDPKIEG